MIFQGLKQKRDHVGRKDKYSWLKEECLAEVRGYEPGYVVNYSELAWKYSLQNESGRTLLNENMTFLKYELESFMSLSFTDENN